MPVREGVRAVILTPAERGRVVEFDALLSEPPGRAAGHGELAGMAALSDRLCALSVDHDPDPVFRARLRQRLVAVASVRTIAPDPQFRPSPAATGRRRQAHVRMPRRAALAAGTVVGLVTLSGVGLASGDAGPGDTLYGVKRSGEAAQLALAQSDVSRGQLHLEFARKRAAEAAKASHDLPALDRILDEMDGDMRTAAQSLGRSALTSRRTGPLDVLDAFVFDQDQRLHQLALSTAGATRKRVDDSRDLVHRISARSAELLGTLRCEGTTVDGGGSDDLGPLPRTCTALPAGVPLPALPGASPTSRPAPMETDGADAPPVNGDPDPDDDALDPTPGPSSTWDESVDGPIVPPPAVPDARTGASASPSPSPSEGGGTSEVLDDLTDVVGDVVGDLLGDPTPNPVTTDPPLPFG